LTAINALRSKPANPDQQPSLTGEHAMALRRIAESRNRKHGKDEVIQEFGTVYPVPIGLGENVRSASTNALNPLLANTMVLRDLYKKHHWQVSGATFYQLHLLFDKHYNEQVELMDALAERIVALGGVPLAAQHDVAEASSLARPPKGRESVPAQITRLLDAHEQILVQSRRAAREASENRDDGTNDLIVSDVIRTNEMHVFFLSEHLADGDPHGHQKGG
jgi:starvation-inducible DNA-binding protein